MVELRKRKAPTQPPSADKKTKQAQPKSTDADADTNTETASIPNVDDTIDLETFGGEIETNEGVKTTLKKLVEESQSGVVLFTYPKASTPGCTKQACSFRDNHTHLTSTGLSIYGLSADSPKANTTFKTKQKLPYPLLCNPTATLIAAIGLKKTPKGTIRGVFAVDKAGKVLLREAGGPDATVDAVEKLIPKDSVQESRDASPSEAQ
ncbi:hypothetical protein NUU61_009686 [Penicillium alfredii]|uniref:thioredoxin-dependent peroxiredoxin n=1 Tax=Penicillium alfredii TaxID=1506179 RepID=A0A9W9JU85_9EURO|nr:uncharacterized protein NUU61_009686 [Penicillium alfredii]KAJ5081422.1 hypothetical protein NUU61_009686 [Penicillium alfredii]